MKVNKTVIISVLLVVLALGGGFFAGMQYQKSQRTSFAGGFMGGANGQFRGRFGAGAGGTQAVRPIRGQVLSIDNTGMTVKLADGSSKIIVVSGSTMFVKSATAAQSDVKTGNTVMVVGTQNADGSITAQDVQINPQTIARPSTMPNGQAQ